jgi:3-deoxy-D-manno-octulosonate 8-phosphate phosphatase KdsC-like HAD superfamily phosphatase
MLGALRVGLRPREAEEAPCFHLDIVEVTEVASVGDDVEQVAVLTGCGIGLMCS